MNYNFYQNKSEICIVIFPEGYHLDPWNYSYEVVYPVDSYTYLIDLIDYFHFTSLKKVSKDVVKKKSPALMNFIKEYLYES